MIKLVFSVLLVLSATLTSAQDRIAVNPRSITAENLEGVQLLELGMETRTFSEAEIKAVTNFLQGGGASGHHRRRKPE